MTYADRHQLRQRWLNGERTRDLAREVGVSPKWMLRLIGAAVEPTPEPLPERRCLMCRQMHRPASPGLRICVECKASPEWRDAVVMNGVVA